MKKAQITTFISIAVILLIAVALFFFIKGELSKDIEPERVIPIEFMDVSDYVEDCLRLVSRNAIDILGLQGGYIYLPDFISRVNGAHIDLIPGSHLKVPLWYNLGNYRLPLVPDMERDINNYIIENLPSCINNFEAFETKYEIDDYLIQPSTFITQRDVLINLKYPLIIRNIGSGQVLEWDEFSARHDVKLRRAYQLAYDILLSNEIDTFLENMAIELMVIDPEIPFSGMEFSCTRKTWRTSDLVNRVKGLFEYNLPSIRIKQTNYIPFREDEQYESLHMLWDLATNEDYKDFSATINFNPDNDFYMFGRPSDGEYLRSSRGEISFLNMFCINNYHFTYDLRFPLLFRLYDPLSFSGSGFEFYFSLPVYIDHNTPLREDFGFTFSRFVEEDEEFCSFKLPQVHTFKAFDMRDGFEIEDVQFYFDCISKRCPLGNTTFDGFNFLLEARLPEYCSGGFVVAKHPDYETASELIYYDNLPNPISVTMREMKTLNLDVKRHRSDNLFLPFSITENYDVLISFTDAFNNQTTYMSYPIRGSEEENTIRLPYDTSSIHFELLLVDESNYLLGGFDYVFNYTRSQIADANTLKLKVYEQIPHPIDDEQSLQVYNFVKNETKNLEILLPQLVFEND